MESGINRKPNILVLTSFLSNGNSSKMIMDVSKSLGKEYNVDILSKYQLKGELNIFSVYNSYEELIHQQIAKYKSIFSRLLNKIHRKNSLESNPYLFFGNSESAPPANSKKILKQINKEYDFVLVFFWQELITSKSLFDIYEEIKRPILLMAADMFPMTGGCSYLWDCTRLDKSCGKCPGIKSTDENDFTRKNFLFKKEMLNAINCIFLGNGWQNKHAVQSKLFNHISTIYPVIDEVLFQPRNRNELKEKFNCANKKVLFFGALGLQDPRKGAEYLLESLLLLRSKKPDLLKDIVLVIAGGGAKVAGLEDFNVNYTGHLTFEELAVYYAMADVFLSPTIQDAGPMMLNQALMCGTPAVAFAIGTACDVINEKTGYLARLRDSDDFCNGILELLDKSEAEVELIAATCRVESLERSSYKSFRESIINAYQSIR